MTYKIQNRSPDNKRIKLIKRSDGRVTFVGNAIPTYQENTIQAGWCMAAITPVPELIDPQTTFELTAAPIGVDGRVSLYRNGTLVSSMRYNDLNSNAAKVKWFNDYFGAVVLMAVIQGITVFTIREDDSVITLVFEDDDIDYNANELSPATPNRTAFFREQYRLAVGLKLTEIDCTGAIVCTPQDLRVSENNILGSTFTAGEWSIDYQLNGGETRTYTTTLGGGDWQWGVFRAMMQSILNQEDSDIQWVGGGGGYGHFQLYNWSLTAGSGGAGGPISGPISGEVDNSRSVKLIRNDNHNADLFWFFFDIFDDLPDGSSVEAISCGFSAFPGF